MVEIRLARWAGFCFGVKRAIEIAQETIKKRAGPVYTLGPLIHNDQVVEKLTQLGIKKIDFLEQAENRGTLIIRSHGVGPQILKKAEQYRLTVVDATCPYVRKTQQLASDYALKGMQVVIIGSREHPEVKGLVDWTNGQALVVERPREVENLPDLTKIAVLAQTTQSLANFQVVVNLLKQKAGTQLEINNTICNATRLRQQAASGLAREVGIMIVVGGKNSANTKELFHLCQSTGTPTYQVETAQELKGLWFKNINTAGLTAGASTPHWILEEVKNKMKELAEINEGNLNESLGENEVLVENQVIFETADKDGELVEKESGFRMSLKENAAVKPPIQGEIVSGTVVQVGTNEVMVDIGAKSEGVIPLRELSSFPNVISPSEVVQVGDKIDVMIIKAEDSEGKLILSKERADTEKAWAALEELCHNGECVEGVVREVVKGGLLVDVGIRGFLPASLVEQGYAEDLNKYLETTIKAKIVELNRSQRKVILSRKSVLEEETATKRQELFANLEEGQRVKGIVRRLTNFGAFIDLGGADGLLHISELAWYRINHPSELLNIDEEIEVVVLRVDNENGKISLSLKQLIPNPWDNITEKYPVDSIVKARVTRLAPFGAFVQLEPGVEGLVHISHLANYHIVSPDEIVQSGDEINVKVLSVNPAEKRMRLSLREANPEPKNRGRQKADEPQFTPQNTEDSHRITIGDVVGDMFEEN
ncbi:MAG TPA: bifunctional 4-hydroxy-3-methylbut-2-enyl diphosphate reductase/30S ribosomal protein S1 [Desulfotomaculum sp.]|nr:bifunctional 4-hydroxy-3-methylbut-2-enyl diphosphate reductase/30S ribosomal protein S1 [Desulfotomaculum sp.]